MLACDDGNVNTFWSTGKSHHAPDDLRLTDLEPSATAGKAPSRSEATALLALEAAPSGRYRAATGACLAQIGRGQAGAHNAFDDVLGREARSVKRGGVR